MNILGIEYNMFDAERDEELPMCQRIDLYTDRLRIDQICVQIRKAEKAIDWYSQREEEQEENASYGSEKVPFALMLTDLRAGLEHNNLEVNFQVAIHMNKYLHFKQKARDRKNQATNLHDLMSAGSPTSFEDFLRAVTESLSESGAVAGVFRTPQPKPKKKGEDGP